jgi:hypothetical protein
LLPTIQKVKKNQDQPKDKKSGKFALTPDSPLVRWNRPGINGFSQWYKDFKPQVLTSRSTYDEIKLTKVQGTYLKEALAVTPEGRLKHSLCLNISPRRHGKSVLHALIVLWLFCCKTNFTIQLLGNNADHTRKTQYNLLKKIILNTPRLRKLIGESNIFAGEIRYPRRGNVIQSTTVSFGSSFGEKLNLLWVSDLHACPDFEPFNAMQASLIDSEESLILIDTNVDSTDGPVHALQRQADEDPGIYCNHHQYRDLEHFLEEAPPWINRAKAKRLQSTLLPAEFDRDILGKRGDAKNQLFTRDIIELCHSSAYSIPVTPEGLKALVKGRQYRCGIGLDRAKNLFGSLAGTDNTVLTVIAKVASPAHGEPEYFLLDQKIIIPNLSRSIKKAIIETHQKFSLTNCLLENYEITDLFSWLSEQKIPVELLNAGESQQNVIFPELYRVAKEGRLHFPADMGELTSELSTFSYSLKANGKFSFGHSQVKFHDDRVYSLAYSIFALRESVLHSYVLGSFACRNRTPNRHHCFLMDGDLILTCSNFCGVYKKVENMFLQYREQLMDSELTLPEFYQIKVRREGARLYQAA